MEWRELTYFPGLEINRQGIVRNAETKEVVEARPHSNSTSIDVILHKGRSSQVNSLLEETWGVGAAEAAGFSRPNMNKVIRSRAWAERHRQGLIVPKQKEGLDAPTFGKRPCTDCGKPTSNYRCEKCWQKKRGFGFKDSGEVSEIQCGDLTALRRAKAETKQRRKKPTPFKSDHFVPMAPRPALPDRQADFFAKQERKMESKTYTASELAALLGVSPSDIANAKYVKSKNPKPGTKMAAVRDGMADRGITWEQLVNTPRGKKAGTEAASEAHAPVGDSASPALIDELDTDPAAEFADVAADMEPENTFSSVTATQYLGVDFGSAPDRTVHTVMVPVNVPAPASRPLEQILKDLRDCLPDATITITLR